MKITRRQLRRIIRESLERDDERDEYGNLIRDSQGNLFPFRSKFGNHMIRRPVEEWEDLSNLETTITQLVTDGGMELYQEQFGGEYWDIKSAIRTDKSDKGIFNGGSSIIPLLEKMGFNESPEAYAEAFAAYADKRTTEGVYSEMSLKDFKASGGFGSGIGFRSGR